MRVILDEQEANSFMALITSVVIDQVELGEKADEAIREWRTHLEEGSVPLFDFAVAMNEALGNKIDDELSKTIRLRDYYRR